MTASALKKVLFCTARGQTRCLVHCRIHMKYSMKKSGGSLVSSQLTQNSRYALKGLLLIFVDQLDEDRCVHEILFFLASSGSSLMWHSV